MKHLLGIPLLLLALVGLTACPKNITFETPAAKDAYYADQALQQVGRVQNTVIDLEAQHTLTTNETRMALLGCRVLDISLPAATGGWKTVAQVAAWQSARTALAVTQPDGTLLYSLPETLPDSWQSAVKEVWGVMKIRIPALTANSTLSVITALVDTALASI